MEDSEGGIKMIELTEDNIGSYVSIHPCNIDQEKYLGELQQQILKWQEDSKKLERILKQDINREIRELEELKNKQISSLMQQNDQIKSKLDKVDNFLDELDGFCWPTNYQDVEDQFKELQKILNEESEDES